MNTLMLGAVFAQMLVRPWSQTNVPLAECVAADFKDAPKADILHYAVPAMSGNQRLPDAYPDDGTPGGTVGIVMAKDEYEPASFVLYAQRDLDKVQLSVGELKNADGKVFPAADLDLKVVKVWYQNRNAWYSYFGDTGFKLVPELLLNDENLIRVDTAKTANYARLTAADGKVTEQWINPPRQMECAYWDCYRKTGAFRPMAPGFADADTLQPVALKKGAFKQFFLTAHAKKDTPAGLYRGEIKVKVKGEEEGVGERGRCTKDGSNSTVHLQPTPSPLLTIPVAIRVLDFVLPKPMCYFDDNLSLYVTFYDYNCFAMIMEENGGDLQLAKKQYYASVKNHVEHGHDITKYRWGVIGAEGRTCVELNRKAGCRQDVAISGGGPMNVMREVLGHDNIYLMYGDEPGAPWLEAVRPNVQKGHEAGFKYFLAGSDIIYRKSGYQFDWHNINDTPESTETTTLWNQFSNGKRLAWYSKQHVGVENPDFNRRQNGLALYLSGYTALANYAHHFGSYNDDSEGYKPMVFTYGQYKGVIDTLQWEGFREGLDDIRYATALVKLARPAARDAKNVERRYAGCKALQVLSRFDKEKDDLTECRLEMIRYIQALTRLNGK